MIFQVNNTTWEWLFFREHFKENTQPKSGALFYCFQVLLEGVQQRLVNTAGQLTATARIVPDYYVYT